jgi:GT2 family glycosyltransferase
MALDRIVPFLVPRHFMSEWEHNTSRVVDQVPGAFYLVRRSLFDRLGGFDVRFFVYYEDVDFALRAKRVGANSEYLAAVFAYHTGPGTSKKVIEHRLIYSWVSKIRYSFKHFGAFWGCLILAATLTCEPITRTIWAIGRGQWVELRSTLRATPRLWARAPSLFIGGLRAGVMDWRRESG